MNDLHQLIFYATSPHDCSYLKDQKATTVFVDPKAQLDGIIYSELSELGFRRSGSHVYRPHCQSCEACIPLRVPVENFKASKSQRRCMNTNRDLTAIEKDSIATNEHYDLYERYIVGRHSDGDMYPPSRKQYDDFLTSEWGVTKYIEFRNAENTLIAVSVLDVLEQGLSAIYFFFDPEEEKRGLGNYNILHLIHAAKERGLPYLFLGYWIKDCAKMSYKTKYRPFQVFIRDAWITVNDTK